NRTPLRMIRPAKLIVLPPPEEDAQFEFEIGERGEALVERLLHAFRIEILQQRRFGPAGLLLARLLTGMQEAELLRLAHPVGALALSAAGNTRRAFEPGRGLPAIGPGDHAWDLCCLRQ